MLILSLIFSAFAEPCKTAYIPLQDQTWNFCNTEIINAFYENQIVELSYQYYIDDLSAKFLKAEIQRATQLVFKFAESQNINTNECLSNLKLDIHQIDMETLNDRKRFPEYQNMSKLNIWGLYDPRFENYNSIRQTAIMITNHGLDYTKLTLAHELSHYWFDRYCWNLLWKKDPEAFAIEFEKFYLKQGD